MNVSSISERTYPRKQKNVVFSFTLLGVSPMDMEVCPGHEARNGEQRQNIDPNNVTS
jgi:hypothetical protein